MKRIAWSLVLEVVSAALVAVVAIQRRHQPKR